MLASSIASRVARASLLGFDSVPGSAAPAGRLGALGSAALRPDGMEGSRTFAGAGQLGMDGSLICFGE